MKTLISVLATIILAACGSKGSDTSSSPGPILYVYGDSFSSMPSSFAWQLGPQLGIAEQNLAIPGTSIQYDAQIGQILRTQLKTTDVVVFVAGINDMRTWGDAPDVLALFKQDLDLALQHFCEAGIIAYIGTTPAMLSDSPAAIAANHMATPAIALEYANIIKEEVGYYAGCETNQDNNRIRVVDVNALYTPTDASTLPDLIHPSPAGHAELLQIFLNAMVQ